MESSNLARTKLMNAPVGSAELRRSSAEFRRAQMYQIRAIVRARLCQHHEQRQQPTKGHARNRSDWRTMQTQVRARLKEISIAAGKARHAYQGRKRAVVAPAGISSLATSEPPLAKGVATGSP